jgi:hypothetical protein
MFTTRKSGVSAVNLQELLGLGSYPLCGYLTGEPLADITRKAMAIVVPSEWYENAPLSVESL